MNDPHCGSTAIYTPFVSFPSTANNLNFDVYYLEAPLSILSGLLPDDIDFTVFEINGFHTGVGFSSTNKDDPLEFSVDLIAKSGFTWKSLFPTVNTDSQGNRFLVFDNQTEVTLSSFLDRKYWSRSTYITTINNKLLQDIQYWILNIWNAQNPIYSLLSATNNPSREALFNPIMRSCICDTFAYNMFFYISGQNLFRGNGTNGYLPLNVQYQNLNVCIKYVTIPNISVSNIISNNIIPVNFESMENQIIDFYVAFNQAAQEILDLEQEIANTIEIIEQAPPDERAQLLRQLEQEFFTVIQLVQNVYTSFEVAFYFGYHPDGVPGFWMMEQPILESGYIPSNLKRSFPSKGIDNCTNSNSSLNDFTCLCIDCDDQTVEQVDVNTNTIWIILIIFIILIVIIIIFIFFFIFK